MKILVISDTHGQLKKAKEICEKVDDADLIIHLGDNKNDAHQIETAIGRKVEWVAGNCDYVGMGEDYKVINTEFGSVYLTHGHREDVKYGVEKLLYKAESLGCKAAFFGHTHLSGHWQVKGMHLVNPGSITFPRDGSRGSYAVVHMEKDSFEATIIYLS